MSGVAEIPGAPLSRHDFDVIHREVTEARVAGFRPDEIIVSSRRAREPFRAFDLPVRPNDELGLNGGLIVISGREPIAFDFEDAAWE